MNSNQILVDGIMRHKLNSMGYEICDNTEDLIQFWRWFGDSQIVDDLGRPLVLLHGTNQLFDAFEADLIGTNYACSSGGFFFTNIPEVAQDYADECVAENGGNQEIIEVYIRASNVLHEKCPENPDRFYDNNVTRILDEADENSSDAVMIESEHDGLDGQLTFVAFHANQICFVRDAGKDLRNAATNQKLVHR